MPEALSPSEVGKEIAEHDEHAHHAEHDEHAHHAEHPAREHQSRDRLISIVEALILSLVALLAAWAGYSAAKWSTDRSLSLARASAIRTKASLASLEANQIRTLDSVAFGAAATAYASKNHELFRIAVDRLRAGYRPVFAAWLATRPLNNPKAPPDPSYLPQYKIPQETEARTLNARADAYFSDGEQAAGTADRYVRLTVLLAAVLFLVGISSRFPVRVARIGLTGVAVVLVVVSLVQLLSLPAPPS